MLDILAITGPIYITIVIGFVTTRLVLFSNADMRVLGKFVINLALSALLFISLAQRSLGEILNGPLPADLCARLAAGHWPEPVVGAPHCPAGSDHQRHLRDGNGLPNSGFVGYPIALLTLGPVAGVVLGLSDHQRAFVGLQAGAGLGRLIQHQKCL